MRRSGRTIKKPESFIPVDAAGRIVVEHPPGTDDEVSSSVSDEEIAAPKRRAPSSKAQQQNKKPRAAPQKKRVSIQAAEEVSDLEDDEGVENTFKKAPTKTTKAIGGRQQNTAPPKDTGNIFYDCLQSGKKVSSVISDWIAAYSNARVACNACLCNFVLISAGAGKNWMRPEIDIEALDIPEITELLTDMIQSMTEAAAASSTIPLQAISKSTKTVAYRTKYTLFWETLGTMLVVDPSEEEGVDGIEILRAVMALLTPFSAMPLPNIRLATTIAQLTLSTIIQQQAVQLRVKCEVTARQLAAESKQGTMGTKYAAILRQKEEYDAAYETFHSTSQEHFDTVFVHRYKDTNDEIRALCSAHIGGWLKIDPASCYRDEYLKYVGWMCFDRSPAVRLEVLRSINGLLDADGHLNKLSNFIERFVDRFVEMSVGDVDDRVALESIKLLRKLQGKQLLDEALSGEQLDRIDEVVFDPVASLAMRTETLGFVFDHTEGFDAVEETVKGAKKKSSEEDEDEVATKQHIALQLETIAEFIEHHVDGDLSIIDMFVEACFGLPQCSILQNWSSLVALLLKDTSDTAAGVLHLSDTHCAILIRLFVASAKYLGRQQDKAAEASKATGPKVFPVEWETLTDCLNQELSRLLTRFKDDEGNLAQLIDLLGCYDIMTSNQKQFKSVLKVVQDVFLASTSATVLHGLAAPLRKIALTAEHLKGAIDSSVSLLLKEIWDKLKTDSVHLSSKPPSDDQRGGGKTSTKAEEDDGEEALYSVTHSLQRFATLWQHIDCRALFSMSLHDVLDELVEVAEAVVAQCGDEFSTAAASTTTALVGAKCAMKCIYSVILWCTRDLFVEARNKLTAAGGGATEEDEAETAAADKVIALREKLLDCLHTWLELGTPDCDMYEHELSLEAFRMIGDLRVLFCSRNSDCVVVNRLAWTPSQELVASMRKAFESAGQRIQAEMVAISDSPESVAAADQLSKQLISGLLQPLGLATIYNTDSLNRRQAAAVLCYLVDQSARTEDMILAWVKRMCDHEPVKYLEVQMVALKTKFQELILGPLQAAQDEDDDEDITKALKQGYALLEQMSVKFTQTLGTRKLREETQAALFNFMKIGIDYSFSSGLANIGFIKNLNSYTRFFTVAHLKLIADYLQTVLQDRQDVLSELEDERNASMEIKMLVTFQAALGGAKAKPPARRRKSSVSTKAAAPERVSSASNASTSVPRRQRGRATSVQSSVLETVNEDIEDMDSQVSVDEDYTEVPPPRSRTPMRATESLQDVPWSRDAAKSSNVKRKYTSRTADERESVKSHRTAESSLSTPKKKPPSYVLGLHMEDLDVSPIASDAEDSIEEQASQGTARSLPKSSQRSVEDDDINDVFAELKKNRNRRR